MIAVSDTGPLHYLALIDCVFLLPELFERVLAPQAVLDELRHDHAPPAVRNRIFPAPGWLDVISVESSAPLNGLGQGEWEAILLAEAQSSPPLLLMDDQKARTHTESRGLRVMGTLGLQVLASRHLRFDLRDALDRLLQTNFRVHPRLIQSLLLDEERRPSFPP